MREFMRIVEGVSPKVFYHGSHKKFRPGTILRPLKTGYVHGTGFDKNEKPTHLRIEQFLESRRPENCVSRSQAVFVVDNLDDVYNAGGNDDYRYEVEPIGPVTRCNLHWYSELGNGFSEMDNQMIEMLAYAYWHATPSNKPSQDLYEYLVGSAKIIREIKW